MSSGGDYVDRNSSASCKPYPFPSCAHHVTPEEGQVSCSTLPMFQTPKCTSSCEDKDYDVSYKADKHYAKSFYVRLFHLSALLVLCSYPLLLSPISLGVIGAIHSTVILLRFFLLLLSYALPQQNFVTAVKIYSIGILIHFLSYVAIDREIDDGYST